MVEFSGTMLALRENARTIARQGAENQGITNPEVRQLRFDELDTYKESGGTAAKPTENAYTFDMSTDGEHEFRRTLKDDEIYVYFGFHDEGGHCTSVEVSEDKNVVIQHDGGVAFNEDNYESLLPADLQHVFTKQHEFIWKPTTANATTTEKLYPLVMRAGTRKA